MHDPFIDNALNYWNSVTSYTHSEKFNFEILLVRALGIKKVLRKFSFPNRNKIKSIMKRNESWANEQSIENATDDMNQSMHKPIPYVHNEQKKCELVVPGTHRMNLHRWIPISLHDTKLDLVFSTNIHGRSLEVLYSKLTYVRCSLFLIEVLQTGHVVGMFTANPIKRNLVHTAGECFIFTLSPNAKCFQWNPSNNPSPNQQNNTDLSLVVKDDYIAMGINKNGSCALRINEDMTEGESYACSIYNNVPLAGDELKEFEIGLVEVYQFIRFDNKAVGSNHFTSAAILNSSK